MIEIKHLCFEDFRNLMKEEHQSHVEEIQSDTYNMTFNPCWDTYETLFNNGQLLALMAFDGDKPIAYLTLICSAVTHSKDYMVASADHFYCHPDYRRKGVMRELVWEAEQTCIDVGIHSISLNIMYNRGNGSDFVESLGYKPAEITYTKVL